MLTFKVYCHIINDYDKLNKEGVTKMKNIFKIYKHDMKKLTTNWVAMIIIGGLVFLPSLYAWFNILASWDPYGSTNGIKVAIVNEDVGSSFGDTSINIGETVVENLKENDSLGWQFIPKEEADKLVETGKIYAEIVIPAEFSAHVISITTDNIIKPSLTYKVNEKINAIAPKITDKGVSTIKDTIDSNITESVTSAIFEAFSKSGTEIKSIEPGLKETAKKLSDINAKMPEYKTMLDNIYNTTKNADGVMANMQTEIPNIASTLTTANSFLSNFSGALVSSKDNLDKYAPIIKTDLVSVLDIIKQVDGVIQGITLEDKEVTIEKLSKLSKKVTTGQEVLQKTIKIIKPLSSFNPTIKSFVETLEGLNTKLTSLNGLITQTITSITDGSSTVASDLAKLKTVSGDILTGFSTVVGNYDSKYLPFINSSIADLSSISASSAELVKKSSGALPNISGILTEARGEAKFGMEELAKFKQDFPAIQEKVNEISTKFNSIVENPEFNQVLSLLINDWKTSSEFMASPVDIHEEKLFPIENYGSAMTPFYSILAIWVGALILVSLLTTSVSLDDKTIELKAYEKYLGKYLFFLTLGLSQGLIIALGDLFLLNVSVSNQLAFIGISLFSSFVFVTIIYTLVSVFGNIGKAVSVVMLVLQVAASGGTFPIEVTSSFFQAINPLLPFTYAISAMRETVGGIVPEVINKDLFVLFIMFAIFMIMGLLLKKSVNKFAKPFIEKLNSSGLTGH